MKCKCNKKKTKIVGWREDSYFKHFEEIDNACQNWQAVLKCPICSQLWLVDRYDKLQSLFAYKIEKPEDKEKSFFNVHKEFLEESRGGYSDKKCVMAGCLNKSLKELAYCPECAINKHKIFE